MKADLLNIEPEGDSLRATVRLPAASLHEGDSTPQEHVIIVPMAAIDARRATYRLDTDEQAIAAIVREHAKRLNNLPDGKEEVPDTSVAPARLRAMGGLRRDVDVIWGSGVAVTLAAAIARK